MHGNLRLVRKLTASPRLGFALTLGFLTVLGRPAEAEPLSIWHDQNQVISDWLKESAGDEEIKLQKEVDAEVALYELDPKVDPSPDAVLLVSNLVGLRNRFHFSPVTEAELSSSGRLYPRFLKTVQQGKNFYGVPLFASDLLVLYRNTEFEMQAPIQPEISPPGKNPFPPIVWPFETPYYFSPFMAGFGAWPEKGEIQFDSAEFVSALQAYRDLGKSGWTDPHCGPECSLDRFFGKKVPMALAKYSEHEEAEKAIGSHLEIEVLPEVGARRLRPIYGTYCLVFPHESLAGKKGPRLRKLIARLTSEKNQKRLFELTSKFPVNQTAFQWVKEKRSSPAVKTAVQEYETGVQIPNNEEMASFWPVLRKTLRIEASGKLSVAEASKFAENLFLQYRKRFSSEESETTE
jgi:hypothetical protein